MKDSHHDLLHALRRRFVQGLLYAAFLSFFLNLLQLTVPIYMLQLYDRVLSSQSLDTLVALTVIAVGGLTVAGILDFIRARVYAVLGDGLARRLNVPALQAAVMETLRRRSAHTQQAIRDLNDLRLFVTGNAISVPLDALWVPLFLAVLFLLHPAYGLVALAAAAVLVAFGLAAELASRRPLAAANEAAAQSFAEIGAAVRHAEVIEAMGMLPALARRWERAQNRMLVLLNQGSTSARALASASRSARLGMQIAILATGAVLVIEREATPGSMIAASIIMGRMLLPFEQLVDGWRQWVFALSALRRVRELLSKGDGGRQTMPLPRPEGRLVVDRLVFVPPGHDRPVLKGISFALEPGEVLGVIGPSAAGKSTLARLLVGIWPPTAGGVYLDGHSVYQWERANFGQYVGYLPQSVSLLDGTIRENIARLTEADPHEVVAAARRADVHEMIGRLPFGYDTEIGDGGYGLSGGQRQRIALARALFGDPCLIVLDEPNANLDHDGEQALLKAIAEAKQRGATVVLIAHRPSIIQVVDKLLVLKDGAIDQFGPRTDIIQSVTGPAGVTRLVKSGERS